MSASERKLVLMIEDNPDDVESAERAWREEGVLHRLVAVEDGVQGLEFLFATGAHARRPPEDMPSAVLLDLKLPKLSGFEVLRRIRRDERTRRVPVIILTSSGEDADLRQAYDLGANSYVRKPVDYEEFAQRMRDLGHYWVSVNEPFKP